MSEPKLVTYSMSDVGTREEHMHQLLDVWSGSLAILMQRDWHSTEEELVLKALKIATELLKKHILSLDSTEFAEKARRTIDALPKVATEIGN